MPEAQPDFAVVVCTRNRPHQLGRTLAALAGQIANGFGVVVIDQSDPPERATNAAAAREHGARHEADTGRGLSRARNVGARSVGSDWVVFVDDDCRPEPEWAAALGRELAGHPEASLVAGHVGPGARPAGDYVEVATFPVAEPRLRAGRWTHPGHVSFGVCMAVSRDAIEALGGWDERLGPGVPHFPAADDMDFNYRLLRSGRTAWASPEPRAVHDQWRTPQDLPALHRGYLAAWTGFALKHMRTGDVPGGLWLWAIGLLDVLHMGRSALRRRSRLRAGIARAKLAGLVEGTRKGWARAW